MFDLMIFIIVMFIILIFILSILLFLLNYTSGNCKIIINSICIAICLLLFVTSFIIGTLIAIRFRWEVKV